MTTTLTVQDETTLGSTGNELVLEFFTQQITVRELIRQRVKQEVKRFNNEQGDLFQGLVQPGDAEQTLNGYRMKKRRVIDWELQAEAAEAAFMTNGFLLLVDNGQLTELEDVIEIRPNTAVTFLKLVPLVGG